MGTKVVVHSNAKRLAQVIVVAILIAAALTSLKKLAAWWHGPSSEPAAVVANAAAGEGGSTDVVDSAGLIIGRASVIDGDTLDVRSVRIRLEGVDAPESSQPCGSAGNEWMCGREAAMALSEWIGDRNVSCRPLGVDRYQRTLARCFVGSEDVQAWLVLNGWALAYRDYSTDYVAAEDVAQQRKAGMWRGDFQAPWEWRKR